MKSREAILLIFNSTFLLGVTYSRFYYIWLEREATETLSSVNNKNRRYVIDELAKRVWY